MHLQEVILCSTAPTSSTTGQGAIILHDIQNGNTLASFKQTSAATHNTAVVNTRDGQGGFILAAQPEKSIMNVYYFQKEQLALKIVLPEKLSCIAVDTLGKYCAAGTSQGRLYLWEIASGIMYQAWDAHYRAVTVLRFTMDGNALLSGSEDSGVNVWAMSRLLDDALQNELPSPYCAFLDHTLNITDIACGVGEFPHCRILTASMDHTVKAWDLASKSQLSSFYFDRIISHLTWDVTERSFFAASADGFIHQVNLFRRRDNRAQILEAVGGGGPADVIRIDEAASINRVIAVEQPITTMTVSLTSSLLLVGTATGLIHLYDIASHQLLKTISTHKGYSITHLATMLKPPDLVGHVSLSLYVHNPTDARETIPTRPVVAFQRMRDPKLREAHDVTMMLPPSTARPVDAFFAYSDEELLSDYSMFVQPTTDGTQSAGVSLQSRVSELESEVQKLRDQLGKAKGINDTMWETVVRKMIAESKEKSKEGGDSAMDIERG